MKLLEFAPTRSIRVRWTLQELGVAFEAVTINMLAGEHRSPAFLRINPAGKLPVLIDGDMVLTESVAIVLYLAESTPTRGSFRPTSNDGPNSADGSYSRRLSSSSHSGAWRATPRSIPPTSAYPAT